jgi:hypothetical protein
VVARQPQGAARTDKRGGFFLVFLDSIFNFFLRPLHVARAWTSGRGGGGCTVPHFLKCAPILEVLILQKFMESGDFTFFQKKILLNLVHTWTFLSTIGIFVS